MSKNKINMQVLLTIIGIIVIINYICTNYFDAKPSDLYWLYGIIILAVTSLLL